MRLGVIGFGEAGQQICKGLKVAGLAHIVVFDKYLATKPDFPAKVAAMGVESVGSLEELVSQSDVVFGVVTGIACKEVVAQAAPHVRNGQLFVDLATKSPETAAQNSQVMAARGARYVDGAMLGPLIIQGYMVPTVASGDGAEEFERLFSPFGMDIQVVQGPAGKASAIKMVRSIFMKGMAAITIEAFVAARLYDVQSEVLASVDDTLQASTTADMVGRFLRGTAIHAARRAHEMEDVVDLLGQTVVSPITARATLETHKWVEALQLGSKVEALRNPTIEELSDLYLSQIRVGLNQAIS